MNATKLALIVSVVAVTLPQTVNAKPAALSKSWAGTWHLNAEKSKFSSAQFTPRSDTRIYTVAGRRLALHSTTINPAGKTIRWSYSAKTDGKWYPTLGNPNNDHIALTFVNSREIKSKTTLKGKPATIATMTISADGKELTLARSVMTAKGGPTDDTVVFERTK